MNTDPRMQLWREIQKDQGVQFFQTRRCWPRKRYLSQRDADQHDAGYAAYDERLPWPVEHGPFRDGWVNAACDEEKRGWLTLEVTETEDDDDQH